MHGMRHCFLPNSWSSGQEQRLHVRGLTRDIVAKRAHQGALAKQGTVDPAAGVAHKLLRDAQLALQRGRALGDARFERGVQRLQLLGAAPAVLIEPRVIDGAGNLVRDD